MGGWFSSNEKEQQNPTQTTEAALVKNTSGKPVTFTMKGNARATAEATGGGTGDQKVSAVLVDGSADFTMQDDAKASAVANSGEEVDWTQMDLTVALKKRMPTVPPEILAKLAKELAEKFGVHHLSDLEFADLKELENKLESVIGVELKRFLAFVTQIKELCRKKKETNDPPSSMYN